MMQEKYNEQLPLGIILVSMFFIMNGVLALIIWNSYIGGDSAVIFLLPGLIFILIGCGIILLDKWAFIIVVVITGFFSLLALPTLLFIVFNFNPIYLPGVIYVLLYT
ncbi:MAG TPA: hypothetical protein ENI49_02275, partial [Thermoplasmatales archaeon]|nr:hypothetical protein [Thermoplasmatales archaeon]